MKDKLKLTIQICLIIAAMGLGIIASPQTDSKTGPVLKLSAEDQRQLDMIVTQLAQLTPQLDAARKQQARAQTELAAANAFIAEYDKSEAIKLAFLYRIAADVCRCESKELEFAADGKSILRKEKGKP